MGLVVVLVWQAEVVMRVIGVMRVQASVVPSPVNVVVTGSVSVVTGRVNVVVTRVSVVTGRRTEEGRAGKGGGPRRVREQASKEQGEVTGGREVGEAGGGEVEGRSAVQMNARTE